MPTKTRKNPTARRVYERIDRSKQTFFTPQNRTVLNRNPSLSTPTSRQQTLTQIDFVCRLPDEDEDMDLDYMPEETPREKKRRRDMPASDEQDEDASYEEPVPKKRKRRKTAPAAIGDNNDVTLLNDQPSSVRPKRKPVSKTVLAPKVKTTPSKGTAKKTAKKSTKSVQARPEEAARIYEERHSPQAQSRRSSEIMMPPPRTPKTVVKTEIPSSQSPGNTPLSMHSRRSIRNDSRSPLKEKSSNRCMTKPRNDGGKSVRWTPKLEVRDTFEGEPLSPVKKRPVAQVPKLVIRDTFEPSSEGSELSTVTQASRSDTISQKRPMILGSDNPMSDTPLASISSDSFQPRLSSTRSASTPTLETIQLDQSRRSEIQETDDELCEGQHGEDNFDIGLDTQAALHNAQTLSPDACYEHEQIPSIVEDFNNAMRAAAKGSTAIPLPPTRTIWSHGVTTNHHHQRDVPSTTALRTPPSKRRTNNHSPLATTQVPRTPPPRLSDSDQASAQLTADLLRETQRPTNPLPSKAPQPRGIPRPSSSPILIDDDDDDDDDNNDDPLPTSTSNRVFEPTPTYPSPPTALLPFPSQRPPVPFSQATTADATQSSPRPSYTQVPSSPQTTTLPRPRTSLFDKAFRAGRPAVPTIISSSPVGSAAERSSPVLPLWDGRPLTDSQLLPDSLMDMTVPRPPWGLSQESLGEE
ncbi:hypothetical protein MMC32_003690 [Xylographa parallela]|nr:hypothetical protein [Xylographa parallela]